MSATSVEVAPSGECLRSKGRYGSYGWQVKRCDSFAIGPYLSALEMRFMTKRYTNRRSLYTGLTVQPKKNGGRKMSTNP